MDAPTPGRHRGALAVLLLSSTLGIMSSTILMPVLELIRSDLGLTSSQAGMLLTINGLTVAVISPFTGWLVDRVGVRLPLAAGLTVYGLAGGAGLVTDDYTLLLASRVIFGVGAATSFAATTVALLNAYQGADRERLMGWRTTATGLGGVAWPLVGGALGGISWQAPFAAFLVGLPLAVAALFVVPGSGPSRGSGASGRDSLLAVLAARPGLLGVYALTGVYMLLTYGLLMFLPQRLAEIGVHDSFTVSLHVIVVTSVSSVVGLLYARLSTRITRTVLLQAVTVLWTAAFLVLGLTASSAGIILAAALLGAGGGVWLTTMTLLVAAMVPSEILGRASALSSTMVFVAQFAVPLLLGPLMDATSITTGFLVVAAGVGTLALGLIRARFQEAEDGVTRLGDRTTRPRVPRR